MTQRLLFTILFASICVLARASTANFNSLVAGNSYAAPALFSDGGLNFDVLSSQVNVATAISPVNPSFAGNYLNLTSGTVLNVNLPTGASQIQFDFIQNTTAALVVNGGWLDVSQIPATVNGVSVTHLLPAKSNWGSIQATGNIDRFVIVGTGFLVDNLNATLIAGLSGDYNKNHVVDAGDYVLWRRNLNTRSGYNSWRANFGATGAGGTAITSVGVPEPSALTIICFALAWIGAVPRTKHRPELSFPLHLPGPF
jgi:hypothetical protein